jgi:hypothetical protein
MANRRIPLERRRFLKKASDRSGFNYFKRELVYDNGWWVYPDEKDEPAPHSNYIGGEGDSNLGDSRSHSEKTAYPSAKNEIWSP